MDLLNLEAQKALTKAAASGAMDDEVEDPDRARLESEEERETRAGKPKRGRGRGGSRTERPKKATACLKKPAKRDSVDAHDPVRRRLFHSGSEDANESEAEPEATPTMKRPTSRGFKRPASAAAAPSPKRKALQDGMLFLKCLSAFGLPNNVW